MDFLDMSEIFRLLVYHFPESVIKLQDNIIVLQGGHVSYYYLDFSTSLFYTLQNDNVKFQITCKDNIVTLGFYDYTNNKFIEHSIPIQKVSIIAINGTEITLMLREVNNRSDDEKIKLYNYIFNSDKFNIVALKTVFGGKECLKFSIRRDSEVVDEFVVSCK